MKRVIFTDLDGTLLDPVTYSYHQAVDAVELLRRKGIPLIFCSAKTRAEQEVYRRELGINDPFVVENGGAIFIPENYFSSPFEHHQNTQGYIVIELGTPYEQIREALKRIERETGITIKGFGDMSVEEVAKDSGLSLEFATLAKQREYDETFKLKGDKIRQNLTLNKIKEAGLSYTHGGKYYAAMKGNDKGKATRILTRLFRQEFGDVESIGIGDSENDLPMLAAVDIPVLVQKPNKLWEEIDLANVRKVPRIGPEGWKKTIEDLIISNL
jgi:mannosyl-3-phosphoglycerate phosphatase